MTTSASGGGDDVTKRTTSKAAGATSGGAHMACVGHGLQSSPYVRGGHLHCSGEVEAAYVVLPPFVQGMGTPPTHHEKVSQGMHAAP